MTTQEIFNKLMKYRQESVRGDQQLDEYFDTILYSVAKVLNLSDQQASALAGEMDAINNATATAVKAYPFVSEPAKPTIEPSDYEITDGYVGSLGKTYQTATAAFLIYVIGCAAQRNKKSSDEIIQVLSTGRSVEWCDSPNHFYDHSVGIIRRKHNIKSVQLVDCACGHSVPAAQVISTSSGTSCPNCYDKMSN